MAKRILKCYDMGIWDNYEDVGLERLMIFAYSLTEAKRYFIEYKKEVYPNAERGELTLDFFKDQEPDLAEDYNLPQEPGIAYTY